MTVCIAALSALGMYACFFEGWPDTVNAGNALLNTLLLPYIALGISVPLVVLIFAVVTLMNRKESDRKPEVRRDADRATRNTGLPRVNKKEK